jgi:uncharacterized protein
MTTQQQLPPAVPAAVSPAAAQDISPATGIVPSDVLQRLIHSLAPDLILLFGSRARNLARPASDIDLLLVGEWRMEPTDLLRHARHLVMHSFPRVDLVVCTHEELAAAQAGRADFLRSILESGILVYQR